MKHPLGVFMVFSHAPYVLAVAMVTSVVTGCGSQRAQDIWAMPDMRAEPSHVSARQGASHPFGTPGSGVRGADAPGEEDELGDLPEAAYFPKARGFWRHDEEDAVREAKRTGRGLLVSFWADWSEECVQLDEDTLRDPNVRAEIFGGYVPLRIDVSEETRRGRVLLERYQVDHVPAIILLDTKGRELDRIDAYVSEELIIERLRSRPTARGIRAGR